MGCGNHFSAAVLAGGLSSRMGRDKAALAFGGGTLLTHQAEKLKRLGTDDLMISGWREPVPDARLIPDETPHRGPLGGVQACLKAARYDAVLFLSVDVPFVPAWALRRLLDCHTGGATVLTAGEKREPLIAVYDQSVLPAVEAALASDRRSMRGLLACVPVREVPYTGEAALLLNCNTPEDYREMLQRIEKGAAAT